MKIICTIGLIVLIYIFGCSKEESLPLNPEPIENEIMPLKIGNFWIGKVTYFDELGNVDSIFTDTTIVNKIDEVNGEKWYLMNDIPTRYLNRSDGLWTWNDWDSGGVQFLRYKFPTISGDRYIAGENPTEVMKVLSIKISVTVPSGVFECYHYKSTINISSFEIVFEYYLSEGHGFIKSMFYLTEHSITRLWQSWELEKINVF